LKGHHLVHVSRVEWVEPHFVYAGTKLNCGTSLDPLDVRGEKPLTHNRTYLYDPLSHEFLPLYPFFVYDDDTRLLYVYDQLSAQRQVILRCPYEVPGAESTRHLAIDVSIVLGSLPSELVAVAEEKEELPKIEKVAVEAMKQYLIEEHPPDANLYLTHFLNMYSQSRLSNKGTRGYDPLTYTPIKLDEALAPAISDGDYALVIMSGNAGDGKTAFIQRLERQLHDRGATFASRSANGSIFTWEGRNYHTVYDGSQDEGATGSDELLDDFFAAFRDGSAADAIENLTDVIAVNEGRLLHFLSNRQDIYSRLHEEVRRQFAGGRPAWRQVLVVNLNRRSVVDGNILDYQHPEATSIFDRLLDRLLDDTYWAPCEGCAIVDRCPVKFNVDTLRDPTLGSVVRQRLKLLFQITHFRHRVHITIRELRSALAYILFGLRECAEIQAHIGEPQEMLPFFYYNAAVAHGEKDRLLRRLTELDVAEVANPQLDSQLNLTPPEDLATLLRAERRTQADMPLLDDLFSRRPQSTIEASDEDWLAVTQFHASIRRKFFFENGVFWQLQQQTGGYALAQLPEIRMVPTRHIGSFAGFLASRIQPDELLGQLIQGLNHGEGMHRAPYDRDYLCLRTGEGQGEVKAFGLFPKAHFRVEPVGIGKPPEFLEYIPEAIVLIYCPREHRMEISLDLYEAILRMRDGYQPSTAELRSFFQNLQMFKKHILGWGNNRVVVLPTEGPVVSLIRRDDQSVAVELA
jgi:hypothetical protein